MPVGGFLPKVSSLDAGAVSTMSILSMSSLACQLHGNLNVLQVLITLDAGHFDEHDNLAQSECASLVHLYAIQNITASGHPPDLARPMP